MKKTIAETKILTLNVAEKPLGRAASKAASMLRGKEEVNFAPNMAPNIILHVKNIDRIKIDIKKLETTGYLRYSGFPSGLKMTSLKKTLADKGSKYIFVKTVKGMLPKNKLADILIKKLQFK